MPRTYIYRTLRSDFIDLCDGDCNAALALDYFWQQGQKLTERQMNDASATPYIPLGWGYGLQVILIPIGKNALKRAVTLLIHKTYIIPHPANGQVGANQVNRYRVNLTIIQRDINLWSQSNPSVWTDIGRSTQTDPSIHTDLPPRSAQTEGVGLHRPQESVRESVKESAAATQPPPPPDETIQQLLAAYLGRMPTPMELQRTASLVRQHGHERTRAAIEDAAAKGGRSVKYVEQIAGDVNPRAAAAPAQAYVPKPYVAEESDEPLVTVEEARAIRARMRLS